MTCGGQGMVTSGWGDRAVCSVPRSFARDYDAGHGRCTGYGFGEAVGYSARGGGLEYRASVACWHGSGTRIGRGDWGGYGYGEGR